MGEGEERTGGVVYGKRCRATTERETEREERGGNVYYNMTSYASELQGAVTSVRVARLMSTPKRRGKDTKAGEGSEGEGRV